MDTLESFVGANSIVVYSIVLPCCHVVATPFLVTLLFNLGPLCGNSNVGHSILLPCCHVVTTSLLVTLFFRLVVTRWQTSLLVTLCSCLRVMRCQTPSLNNKFPRVI